MLLSRLDPRRGAEGKPVKTLKPCSVLASALREARTDRQRVSIRNALASNVRAVTLRAIRAEGIASDVAEDLAHDLLVRVLGRIEAGAVTPGSEEAYVRRAAANRARDHFRSQRPLQRPLLREHLDAEAFDEDGLPANDNDAERQLVALEQDIEDAARLDTLAQLLETAPARYRAALYAVYIEGRPIEDLVRLELAERAASISDRTAYRRARATVDKTLERARTWLRERLLKITPARPAFARIVPIVAIRPTSEEPRVSVVRS